MQPDNALFDAMARLLAYPDGATLSTAESAAALARSVHEPTARLLDLFRDETVNTSREDLEETYNRTFDINPVACMEVGWHIYGDTYDRGGFLVEMRGLLRDAGVAESTELPDHLTHVLALLGRLPLDRIRPLVRLRTLPAVDKMIAALDTSDSPYRHLIRAVGGLLDAKFGRAIPLEVSHE